MKVSNSIYKNNTQVKKSKSKRKIVVSDNLKAEVSQYIKDTFEVIKANPELKEIKGLNNMLTNSIQAIHIMNVENHVNKVLDMTDEWIRRKRIKRKTFYRKIEKNVDISEETFRKLLSKQKTKYALRTRLKVANHLLKKIRFDEVFKSEILAYEQGQVEAINSVHENIKEAKETLEAYHSGSKVSIEERTKYIENNDKYRERIKEKIANCKKPKKKADCMYCNLESLCERQK